MQAMVRKTQLKPRKLKQLDDRFHGVYKLCTCLCLCIPHAEVESKLVLFQWNGQEDKDPLVLVEIFFIIQPEAIDIVNKFECAGTHTHARARTM